MLPFSLFLTTTDIKPPPPRQKCITLFDACHIGRLFSLYFMPLMSLCVT